MPTPDEVARGDVPGGESSKGCLFVVAAVAVLILILRKGERS